MKEIKDNLFIPKEDPTKLVAFTAGLLKSSPVPAKFSLQRFLSIRTSDTEPCEYFKFNADHSEIITRRPSKISHIIFTSMLCYVRNLWETVLLPDPLQFGYNKYNQGF